MSISHTRNGDNLKNKVLGYWFDLMIHVHENRKLKEFYG